MGIQRPGSPAVPVPAVTFLIRSTDAANFGGRHVVEEDRFGAVGESLFELLRGAHFDLHALRWPAPGKRAGKDCRDAAAEGNVIVLDQNAGSEIDAVIGAAAAKDGVFFKSAHAWHGLARVEHPGVGALNRVGDICA